MIKKISDNLKNLFFVNIYDEECDLTIHRGVYTGTFEEIKTELSSVYGNNDFILEISHCVVDELPLFEDII